MALHNLPPPLMQNPGPAPAPAPAPPQAVLPPVPQPDLLLTRQPFNHNWPVHYMGKMDVICSNCNALHWDAEKLSRSLQGHPLFGTCCYTGKIQLPRLDNPPRELWDLLSGQDDISKKFRDKIRNYNNALAMTSLGCDQDRNINRDGGGPYIFKVQGRLYHQAGAIIPRNDTTPPVYAQLYIHDAQDSQILWSW